MTLAKSDEHAPNPKRRKQAHPETREQIPTRQIQKGKGWTPQNNGNNIMKVSLKRRAFGPRPKHLQGERRRDKHRQKGEKASAYHRSGQEHRQRMRSHKQTRQGV